MCEYKDSHLLFNLIFNNSKYGPLKVNNSDKQVTRFNVYN